MKHKDSRLSLGHTVRQGLVEQLPDLQALGVKRPKDLSDLLVEDFEEVFIAVCTIMSLHFVFSMSMFGTVSKEIKIHCRKVGLSRVQIRQLQRAISHDPAERRDLASG